MALRTKVSSLKQALVCKPWCICTCNEIHDLKISSGFAVKIWLAHQKYILSSLCAYLAAAETQWTCGCMICGKHHLKLILFTSGLLYACGFVVGRLTSDIY